MVGFAWTTSRTKAFGLAASLALAAYFPATSQSSAQDLIPKAVKASLPTACLKLHGTVAQLDCGTAYNRKMEQVAREREATAQTRIAEADKEAVCLNVIMKDLEANGTKTANLSEPPKRGEARKVAKSLNLVAGS